MYIMKTEKESLVVLLLLFGFLMDTADAGKPQEKSHPEWKQVGRSVHESTFEMYYDSKNLKRTPEGTIRVWLKQVPVYENDQEKERITGNIIENRKLNGFSTVGYDKYAYSTTLVEFKCKTQEGRSVFIVDYDEAGKVIGKQESRILEWAEVAKGSIIMKVFNVTCAER